MKLISMWVGGFVLFFALILGLDYSSLIWESFIGPKRENIRRQIFEETKSYNQGMQQELIDLMHQYNMAKDKQDKKAIMNTVRIKFSDYNEDRLSSELRDFLKKCKYDSYEENNVQ
jgi:hypothetical protein